MRSRLSVWFIAIPVVVVTACSSSSSAATVVKVAASDNGCVLDATDLVAGSTTFRITNGGKKVTELYVYAPGDRVVTERENIGPGTRVDVHADLAAGTYEVACKPGQTGDGIRSTITVSAG